MKNIFLLVFLVSVFSCSSCSSSHRSGTTMEVARGESRVRMAILPLKGAAPANSDLAYFGPSAQSIFTTSFSKLSQLELIERERIDDISQELQRQQTDLFDAASRSALGKLLGVRVMLFGSYFQLGTKLRIDARMVEVETGKVLHAVEVTDESSNLFDMLNELTKKFSDALERGDIIKMKEQERGELNQLPSPEYAAFPQYSDGIKKMDEARELEKREEWTTAKDRYKDAQKAMIKIAASSQNFEPAKTALRRIDRKLQELDYILETGQRIPVRVWSLIVGVNSYQAKNLPPLKYAVADAKLFDEMLRSPQCGAVPSERVRLLLDSNASRVNILAHLDYLLKASGEDDLLLLYFAGHGYSEQGSFYFMGNDGDPTRVSATGVAASQINDMIQKLGKFKKVVWVIDACYSGASAASGERSVQDATELLSELAKSENGYVILSASNEYQKALEFSDRGHGVFTYYLAEGMKGNADEAPSDGYVRARELSAYVGSKVQSATNARQTPKCFGCEENDFPLARVR